MNEIKENSEEMKWLEQEYAARKDRKWLRYSSKIARRVIAELRGNKEINQKQLAERIDVSPQYINKVLKGQENLTLETISKLSDALGVELISFPAYKYSSIPEQYVAHAPHATATCGIRGLRNEGSLNTVITMAAGAMIAGTAAINGAAYTEGYAFNIQGSRIPQSTCMQAM
jgi:transcriptional regulator with XRE-family HTH domain